MSKSRDRSEAAYWERRLFRASFTYRGRRRWVPGWRVRIQWAGRRHTLRLPSPDRRSAADEARVLYLALRSRGWEAIARRGPTNLPASPAGLFASASPPLPRVPVPVGVGTRKYVSDLNPGFHQELFATVAAEGRVDHFALGTEDLTVARVRAADLGAELGRDGSARLRLSRSWEATVAVFWQANPMTCTYTTLLTHPAAGGTAGPEPARPRGWSVLVIEPDGGVRRALAHWLRQTTGIARIDGCPITTEVTPGRRWDLILVNREQPASALRDLLERLPGPPALTLTHGVFADSDAIFASFSGVSLGYLLRRVAPAFLLEPLLSPFPDGPPRASSDLDRPIRRYFQAIFEPDGLPAGGPAPGFSLREQEILDLLSRGFADKEIARELGISVWTVHSHLKRIFAKYGVRTRTEAVVRHLQK